MEKTIKYALQEKYIEGYHVAIEQMEEAIYNRLRLAISSQIELESMAPTGFDDDHDKRIFREGMLRAAMVARMGIAK